MFRSPERLVRICSAALLALTLLMTAGCFENRSDASGDNTNDPAPNNPDGTPDTSRYRLSGVVTYQDKPYGTKGFIAGDPVYNSARYVLVDLLDGSGTLLATTATDDSGAYGFDEVAVGDYTVRVIAATDPASGLDFEVARTDGATHAVTSTITVAGATTHDIQIGVSQNGGAFNILDTLTSAGLHARSLSNDSYVVPALKAFWQVGNNSYGTYTCTGSDRVYCPVGAGIYVLGGRRAYGEDSDEYDDDVLTHEFGHVIENSLGILDSPGGPHWLTDNTLDLRLAWSEGLSDSFPAFTKGWLSGSDPDRLSADAEMVASYYIDTYGEDKVNIAFDFNRATVCPGGADCYTWSTNEVAVARSLIRLVAHETAGSLWQVLSEDLPNANSNMESFWDGWLAKPAHTKIAEYAGAVNERKIHYLADAYEPDDDPATLVAVDCTAASPCLDGEHYLYHEDGSADVDYLVINVAAGRRYTIQTHSLRNGADTYMQVFDSTGALLAESDDPAGSDCYDYWNKVYLNDGACLASRTIIDATVDEVWQVKVRNTPQPTAFAGRYGTYNLKVTSAATP